MPQYEYFCHNCKKAFSNILGQAEHQESVACPHCGRQPDVTHEGEERHHRCDRSEHVAHRNVSSPAVRQQVRQLRPAAELNARQATMPQT